MTLTIEVEHPLVLNKAPHPESQSLINNEPAERPVRVAMSNAFGFGGHNTTVIFEKFEA